MTTATIHLWIDTRDALEDFIAALPAHAEIGVDTEFMRRDTFYPQLALVQLAGGGHTALVDPCAFKPDETLRPVLADPATCTIMHSASEDMEALSAILPHGPGQLFDTQIAAALVGMGQGLSYRNLVLELTGAELDKGETRSNWLQRPLTASQRAYAALDVHHLHALHSQLDTRLAELGRRDWLREECARLARRAERDAIDPQPQRKLHAAADWPREQQALLRRLLLWRERTARELDKPRPWLASDTQLLDLVAHPPTSSNGLREQLRGQRALRSAQAAELFAILQAPLESTEIDATRAIPPAADRKQRDKLKSLKQLVARRADEIGIPAGLLCPRRLLEEVLVERHWPHELDGWRKPLLAPILQPLATP